MGRLSIYTLLIALLILSTISCGCITGAAEKSNAIDSLNICINSEIALDAAVAENLETLNDHLTYYNDEVLKTSPNYDLIIRYFSEDRDAILSWEPKLCDLDNKINDFASNSSGLSGDQQKYADLILTNIRGYYTGIYHAQCDFVTYCDDITSYLNGSKLESVDDSLVDHANDAKDRAVIEIRDAYDCIDNVNDYSKRLEKA
jgi:hypothetical protein